MIFMKKEHIDKWVKAIEIVQEGGTTTLESGIILDANNYGPYTDGRIIRYGWVLKGKFEKKRLRVKRPGALLNDTWMTCVIAQTDECTVHAAQFIWDKNDILIEKNIVERVL